LSRGKKVKILNGYCFSCKRDLTLSNYDNDWALAVINFRIPSEKEGLSYKNGDPHLKENLKFCNLNCLEKWVKNGMVV